MQRAVAIEPKRVAYALGGTAAVLVVASVVTDLVQLGRSGEEDLFFKINRMVDLDSEHNIPTFFSTTILLLAAGLLGVIAVIQWQHGLRHRVHWAILSVIFVGLAFDEYASIHETLIEPFRREQGVFYFGWVIPGAVFVVVTGAFFARFLLQQPPPFRALFISSGAVFVGGALGVELFEGQIASTRGESNSTYIAALTVQETMEMAGIILFIYALLRYLGERSPRFRFELGTEAVTMEGGTQPSVPSGPGL